MRKILALIVIVAALVFATAASAQTPLEHFGRIFPNLPGFTTPTVNELLDLSLADQDPNKPPENLQEPSGMTYLGQFLDHDSTLDTLPQPTTPVDPTTLLNNRTFKLDLDSVFGRGPIKSPQFYVGQKLCIQSPNVNGVPDLCRNADGSAVIPEGRNDENEIISQIQVAFIEFYNRLIDQGYTYHQARRTTTNYWQWMVLHELMPTLFGQDTIDRYLTQKGDGEYKVRTPLFKENDYTPVEFSVATYRLHTIVRLAYVINDNGPNGVNKIQVFNATGVDLHGGRQLPADRQIEWGNFVTALAETPPIVNNAPAADFNFGRPNDSLISKSLYNLPIPGAEPSGSNNLAFRNLIRGQLYGLPSGQDVARELGLPVIPASEINPTADPVFNEATPLWQYMNAESARTTGGARVGPLGSAIDVQVFLRVLADDKHSILNNGFEPDPSFSAACTPPGFSFADFVVYAGAADCPA